MTEADHARAPDGDGRDLDAVLREINARHGTDFVVSRRFDARVNSGAAIVTGSQGRRVLKWIRPGHSIAAQRNAAATTAALRPKGYPVPVYERIEAMGDSGYVLMTELPGGPADFRVHGPALVAQVIALNELQYGAAVLPTSWPHELVTGVVEGGDGYCFPEAMRQHSRGASALLDELRALARDNADAPTLRDGVVHKDMNPGNVLAASDAITGVVDWENTCSGDPVYDVAYLWFCIYDHDACRPLLWRHIVGAADPRTIALCLAHVICGFTSGAIAHQTPAAKVGRRLAAADSALADLRRIGVTVRATG